MKIHRKFIQGLMLLALIMVAGVVHAQQQSVFDVTKEIGIKPKAGQVHSFLGEENPLKYDDNLYCINSTGSVLVAKLLANGDYAKHWKQYENGNGTTRENLYLWVFVPKDFVNRCKEKKQINTSSDIKALSQRLSKLLGLNTDQQRDTIVYMKVPKDSLFRPAYVTDIGQKLDEKNNDKGNNAYINQLNDKHRKWMVGQQTTNDYPWTRMGYTYDWGGANEDYIGVAEFILKPKTGFDKVGFITIDKIYDNVGVWPGSGQSNQ